MKRPGGEEHPDGREKKSSVMEKLPVGDPEAAPGSNGSDALRFKVLVLLTKPTYPSCPMSEKP
jgi:hypothetical protein